ncbi:MAG: response regulator [bacterium]|nr:response regulator [bacterium]
MATSIIHILMINKNLSALLGMKQALERTSEFEVSSFTTPDAALELLRARPHDIAIVEFGLPSMNGQELVSRIRAISPDIRILASPHMPAIMTMARQLNLDGVVDVPMSLRDLLPILKKMIYNDALPDTSEALPMGDESDTLKMSLPPNKLDEVLTQMGNATFLGGGDASPISLEVVFKGDGAELDENPHDDILFKQLAAEEPPMPTLEEIGTVADLRDVVGQVDLGRVNAVLQEALTPYMPLLPSGEIANQATENIPAQHILRETHDDTQSLQVVIGKLIDTLANDSPAQKLPFGWRQDLEKYIKEPDFLSIVLEPNTDSANATTHAQSSVDVVKNPHDLETDRYPKEHPKPPKPTSLPKQRKPAESPLPPMPISPPPPPVADIVPTDTSPTAQLALTLTQTSLELSADATLLIKNGKMVAHAGELPDLEIAQLVQFLADDGDAQPDEARLKFITLPISGQEYMVYSRLAAGKYTLAMVFGGSIPLRAMRKQSDRLLSALQSVPEIPQNTPSILDELQERELEQLEVAVAHWESSLAQLSDVPLDDSDPFTPIPIKLEPLALPSTIEAVQQWQIPDLPYPVYSGTPAPFTYVWRLAHPDSALSPQLRDVLRGELERQLTEMGITITTLVVQETYIYLLAKTPSETPPHVVINDLKQRSAWIIHHVDRQFPLNGLWAESYCVLAPGREMQHTEIEQFIAFSVA